MSHTQANNDSNNTHEPTAEFLFGDDLIDAYSRAQAMEDGVLVDVTGMAKKLGFGFPVAVSQSVFIDCVEWSSEENRRKNIYVFQKLRLFALLKATMSAAREASSDILYCSVDRIPQVGDSSEYLPVRIKAVIGPGDTAAPVITIMGIDED